MLVWYIWYLLVFVGTFWYFMALIGTSTCWDSLVLICTCHIWRTEQFSEKCLVMRLLFDVSNYQNQTFRTVRDSLSRSKSLILQHYRFQNSNVANSNFTVFEKKKIFERTCLFGAKIWVLRNDDTVFKRIFSSNIHQKRWKRLGFSDL